uniref:Dynamin family protein n=1 Tax=Candidatus Kentrum sp. LFY TaxID=2126342 RepID=A0A450UNS4_9GAMM|nr:MAG: Dynamin family protein [Candidatus Kentron sp. LFY]
MPTDTKQKSSTAIEQEEKESKSKDGKSFGSFVDYNRTVLKLVSDLKHLRNFANELERNEAAECIDEVLERVEKDKFTVGVVGEFKRGKSTFINALLGSSILPADVLPTTATLNRISYDLNPHVVLQFKNGEKKDVPFDKLEAYITKLSDESAAIAKTIEEATVFYPSNYCKNNVEIIDTPGLNDSAAMTEVTLSVLPKIDVAIMVILAQAPFSEHERDFLEDQLLSVDLGRVIFVVNRIDDLNRSEDVNRVIESVERRIQKYVIERAKQQFGADSPEYETYIKKVGRPRVFGLSAYQAIQAKQNDDAARLKESRFPVFENDLQKLLTEGRGAITLQIPVDRIISTCRDILYAVNLRRNTLTLESDEFERSYNASSEEITDLKRRKSEELEKVKVAERDTREKIAPLADELPEELKNSIEKAIEDAEIDPKELDNRDTLNSRLGKLVDNALRRASDKQATFLQMQIDNAIASEIERLAGFAQDVSTIMRRVDVNFGAIEADGRVTGRGEAVAAVAAVVTGFGGLYGGYRQAGVKGAAVGTVASVGAVVVGSVALAVLGLPVTLPAIIGISIASILPGSFLAKIAFKKDRVELFREKYKSAVLKEFGQALSKIDLKHQVHQQVEAAFEALHEHVSKEVNATLSDAESTLLTLRAQYERKAAMTSTEQARLHEIEQTTLSIDDAAGHLSKQLAQVVGI